MKTLNRTLLVSALVTGGLVCTSTETLSEQITFTVDPTQSSLTVVSASLNAPVVGSIPLEEQAPGSLVTDYGGMVKADVTATSIEFIAGSSIVASNSGNWEPGLGGTGAPAPANYGGQGSVSIIFVGDLEAKVAMRGIVSDATSGSLPLTGGAFPADTMVFGFDTNANSVLDYSYSGLIEGSGTYVLTGLSTNDLSQNGLLETNGNELVLTVPVNYTGFGKIISETEDDLTYTLNGTLVARAPLGSPAPLEIHSLKVNPGELIFNMATVPGENYMILGGPSPEILNNRIATFTATNSPTVLMVNKPILQKEFFTVAVFAPMIHSLQVNPGELTFNISTVAGENYTILGGTDPGALTNTVDTFPATNSTTTWTVSRAILPQEFFQVRQD